MFTDDAANEIYVADGYGNRRVIVFDMKTGAYKRHWGAYGNAPNDDKQPPYSPAAEPSKQFSNPVHCVRVSNDGLVYVCDRANNRIQVFRRDGAFVKEFKVEAATLANGAVWDLVLSEDKDQRYIFVADGANGQIICARARQRRIAQPVGPPRPSAGPVQVGAQHRNRRQGQPLHRRGRVRAPRTEVQADELNAGRCADAAFAASAPSMEFLRHPLYSILAVILIGAVAGLLAQWTARGRALRERAAAALVGIGAAFLGFHFAMLSNLATGVIIMPFAVALVVSLLVSFALRAGAR